MAAISCTAVNQHENIFFARVKWESLSAVYC